MHTHLLLTTPTSHTHRFHPLSKIVIHTSVQYGSAEAWMTILKSRWNLWVWLVGVVSRRCVWLVVKRYIDILTIIINFPYSTCINSFFGGSTLTSLFIFLMFFRSCSNKDRKNILKINKEVRMLLPKKRPNTSGVGKINNFYEDIYIPPYNNTD